MLKFFKRRSSPLPEFEYVPDGWARKERMNVRGWDDQSVPEVQGADFEAFKSQQTGSQPLGVQAGSRIYNSGDLMFHNTALVFAYTLALAAHRKDRVAMLDWGGGLGKYGLLAEQALPGVKVDYCCKEVPALCEAGKKHFPNATFMSDDAEFASRQFDLVLASGSIQYVEHWQPVLQRLAAAADPYLLVTRLPVTIDAESFVILQRPYSYGYKTEYLGWCLRRDEFVHTAEEYGLDLMREFVLGETFQIEGAPAPYHARGFLFCRQSAARSNAA